MSLRISGLAGHHDRRDFDCGEAALNEFLQKLARQQGERDFCRTYVAVEGDEPRIRGFYALSAGSIEFQNWPVGLRLPRYPIPVARIARLAVDLRDQGSGVGTVLLNHALASSVALAAQIGLHAVVVDAKHERAASFYARYGFRRLQEHGLTLFLRMSALRQAFVPDH
jgi:ribosomal protein S18 acetylase RimI-like enzyme